MKMILMWIIAAISIDQGGARGIFIDPAYRCGKPDPQFPIRAENDTQSERVVGGSEATAHSLPWQIYLDIGCGHKTRHPKFCGGSIVDEQWVVTAAHCFRERCARHNISIHAGMHDRNGDSGNDNVQVIKVAKLIQHPSYLNRRNHHDNDIALLKLETSLEFNEYVKPICLFTLNPTDKAGQHCLVSGWGKLNASHHGQIPEKLQQVYVPIITNEDCSKKYKDKKSITDSMVCAGHLAAGGIDACTGDSGGPLACQEGDNWYLAGIVSFGIGCADPNFPGVYARVFHFKDWIEQEIGPPNFKVEPQDTVVESGDTVTMNCVVEGEPEPEITWRKLGPVLENGTDRITILQNQSLRIAAAQKDDTGMYICMARNPQTSELTQAQLAVQVHGGWSEWTEWGQCSETCGEGLAERSRTCDSPLAQDCTGKDSDRQSCNLKPCAPPPPFTLPPYEDVDITAAGELFLLHEDGETVSLYHPDAAAGFRLQWTRPAPAATAGRPWDWILAAGDGRALLHDWGTEAVLLAADWTEAGRWRVEGRWLEAASSSHAVYSGWHLRVYAVTDHSTRLFSLTPRHGGRWKTPSVGISPAGTILVEDNDKKLLVAFSSTGERLYQVDTAYRPSDSYRAVSSNDQHVFVLDDDRRDVVHVHAAASGDHVTTLHYGDQLQDGEKIRGVWAGQGQTLYFRTYKDGVSRIITQIVRL